MSVAAAIEAAGSVNGVNGLGSASDGVKFTAISRGMLQPPAQAETFGSRWQAFLHSLGMEPAGLALREQTAEENLDPLATGDPTGESGQIQAKQPAPGAAALPSQTWAGPQDGSLEGSPRIRTTAAVQGDALAGNETAGRAQRTASGARTETGSASPAAGISKGFERKDGAEAQVLGRAAAQDVTSPGMNATDVVAAVASIPGTPALPPTQSPHAAARFAESFLSSPSLESEGAPVGSRAGVRLGTQQGTGNWGAQLPNGAAAAGRTPAASSSIVSEARAASGEALAAHEDAAVDQGVQEMGFQEAAPAHAHITGGEAPSEGDLAAGPDGSLAGGQPDSGTLAANAGFLAATESAGGANLQPALGLQALGQVVRRTARTAGVAETAEPGGHSVSPQSLGFGESGGLGAVGAIPLHDLSVARSAPGALHNGGASLTNSVPTGAQETFAALDASAGPGTVSWVHAGPQRAEAGFQDPALGWIGVRADLGAGAVHAAVLAGSSEAAQALGGHMAGLNAYLTEHHAGVASLTMTSPEGGSANWGGSPGAMQQGASGNDPQSSALEPQTNGSFSPAAATREIPAQSGGLEAATPEVRQGKHISVMA
jgi:hypothetical protein